MLSSAMHKKRLVTLLVLVTAVLKSKRLSLTGLGRAVDLPIKERSAIRRVDRFLGNQKIHKEKEIIHEMVSQKVIGSTTRPNIIVDWSNIPNTTCHTLRASVAASGRAITLLEEVHPEKKLGTARVQRNFLRKLKEILLPECKPIIITDAGFHNDWFRDIQKLGWDYLGRVRKGSGKKYHSETAMEWRYVSVLFKMATSRPKFVGKVCLCMKNMLETNLYLFKGKPKKRKSINRSGKKRCDSTTRDHQKSAREAWLLATSLTDGYFTARSVVKKYSMRMQIEEGFRDLKSTKYGFGLENAYSRDPARIEVLLLIAMLASFIAWLTGFVAEKMQLHYQFQSSSVKSKRILSLFFLGCQVIKKQIKIPMSAIENAIKGGIICEA